MSTTKAFLLKLADDETPHVYHAIGGFRNFTWNPLRSGRKVRAHGIFSSEAAMGSFKKLIGLKTGANFQLSIEGGIILQGRYAVTGLFYAGDFNGERSYSIYLQPCSSREKKP